MAILIYIIAPYNHMLADHLTVEDMVKLYELRQAKKIPINRLIAAAIQFFMKKISRK